MSNLKKIRESQHLTQEELSTKSGISVRTIQRIETGKNPKGFTLKTLAQTLGITENDLIVSPRVTDENLINETELKIIDTLNYRLIKIINLSSLPFIILPPLNIIVPLILIHVLKQKSQISKQIVTIQLLWTILAPIIFMLGLFLKLGNRFTIYFMAFIFLSNVFIILMNTASLDKNKKLSIKLNFNMF